MTTFHPMQSLAQGVYGSYVVLDGAPFARGGVGRLYACEDASLVLKKYVDTAKAPALDQLNRLVSIGRDVLVAQQRRPGSSREASINWPLDLIPGPGGTATGVILPRIPATCFDADGDIRGLEAAILARANPPGAQGRVALLIRMAEILDYLDDTQLVHGDISGKNLAWSLDPAPLMYLIDCDSLVPRKPPPTIGVATPGWMDPRLAEHQIPAQDHHSDHYNLALAIYRGLLLTPGNLHKTPAGWTRPARVDDVPDPGLRAMLHRTLDNPLDAACRPEAHQWVTALAHAYLSGSNWNTAALKQLDTVADAIAREHRGRTDPLTATRRRPAPFRPLPPVNAPRPRSPLPVRTPVWTPVQPLVPAPTPPRAPQPSPWQAFRPPPRVPRRPRVPRVGRLARLWTSRPWRYHRRAVVVMLLLPWVSVPMSLLTWWGLRSYRTTNPPMYARGRFVCVVYLVLAVCWPLAFSIFNHS
jgi:hypothetical protein